jgi:hypothetical protein
MGGIQLDSIVVYWLKESLGISRSSAVFRGTI